MNDPVTIAMLPNVAGLLTLMDNVMTRHLDLPGMATFYGPSGDGKTYATMYAAEKFNAVLVECDSSWAKKDLCEAILDDLGITKHERRIADMVSQIADALIENDRPLIVDEADFLVQRKMIEILRDIHRKSQAPVILVGEELLPQKLTKWERIHNRMLDWVYTVDATLNEVDILAELYVPGVQVGLDLRQRILTESRKNIRRISTNLHRVNLFAQRMGISEVALDDWGDQPFFTGMAPVGRSGLRRVGGRK